MSGRPWMSEANRQALVRQVETARANDVPWKVITHIYGRSRTQLHRDIEAARNGTKNPGNGTPGALREHAEI